MTTDAADDVAERPPERAQNFASRIVRAEQSDCRFQRVCIAAMFYAQLAAEGAQFLPDPGVDRRRTQRPWARPADAVVFERYRREELARFERPAPCVGRYRAVACECLGNAERRSRMRLIARVGDEQQCRRRL